MTRDGYATLSDNYLRYTDLWGDFWTYQMQVAMA